MHRRLTLALVVGTAATALALAAPASVRGTGITFIGFDDVPQQCFFINTTPLRGRYAAAKFSGPAPGDGGAALDLCGGWLTLPRTGDRFLAFNAGVTYADGGTPKGPETIKLTSRQKKVSIWVSQQGTEAATFKLVGKRAGRTITSTTASTSTSDWLELKLRNKKGFDTLVLSAPVIPDGTWTADDLTMSN